MTMTLWWVMVRWYCTWIFVFGTLVQDFALGWIGLPPRDCYIWQPL